jgi:hypothetical protein
VFEGKKRKVRKSQVLKQTTKGTSKKSYKIHKYKLKTEKLLVLCKNEGAKMQTGGSSAQKHKI